MFLHHTMTDSEILRTCDGCESHHLKLVADRLRERVEDLRVIAASASHAAQMYDVDDIRDALTEIQQTAKNGE